VKKQLCDQLITETEQSFQKMGLDLYEIMQRAPAVVEKWKRYYGHFQQVWNHAGSREELTAFLLSGPDPSPEEMETVLTLIRTVPYLLRRSLQAATQSLPPSPGGRPQELRPEQRKEICLQIGQLYGQGIELRDAQKRMAQRYGVSLRTIQRAWQEICNPSSLKTNVRANMHRSEVAWTRRAVKDPHLVPPKERRLKTTLSAVRCGLPRSKDWGRSLLDA